jgi:glycosyltransferase involved in cell wall biosynthesis
MLSDETIICLAPEPWTGLWRNRHQIMTRLARRNTVLYVEPRLYLWETLRRFRTGRLHLADLRRPLATPYPADRPGQGAGGLWIYHDPYYAPVSGRRTGGPLTAALRRRAMLRTLRELAAPLPPILWLVRPYFADVIGQYGEKLVVYHVTDEYSAYASVTDRERIRRLEEAVLRRADLVIVTAPALLASKGPFNPHTYLVPNAVDYEGFQRALAGTTARDWVLGIGSIPNTQYPIPNTRLIGYSGALNEKVDYELLAQVARARPDWQIVLIGLRDLYSQPHKADVLDGLPNVHWVGRLPLEQLPAAIASLDVCLLPYEINEWTANIDSLKLYEYLACGRPVVSTDVPAARAFSEVVRIAAGPSAFIEEIAAALAEDDPAAIARRKAVAAANTWEHRVARIKELLVEALERRRSPLGGRKRK